MTLLFVVFILRFILKLRFPLSESIILLSLSEFHRSDLYGYHMIVRKDDLIIKQLGRGIIVFRFLLKTVICNFLIY